MRWRHWLICTMVAVLSFSTLPATAAHGGEKWKRLYMKLDRILQTVFGRKKSMHAFYSDHYGYYPNTWRRWPAHWEAWRQRYSAAQGAPIQLPAEPKDGAEAAEGATMEGDEAPMVVLPQPSAPVSDEGSDQ